MDALGLALSITDSANLQILAAGYDVDAPAGAIVAIVCVQAESYLSGSNVIALNEQIYVVTKGNECRFSFIAGDSTTGRTWAFGSKSAGVNVIYLG